MVAIHADRAQESHDTPVDAGKTEEGRLGSSWVLGTKGWLVVGCKKEVSSGLRRQEGYSPVKKKCAFNSRAELASRVKHMIAAGSHTV